MASDHSAPLAEPRPRPAVSAILRLFDQHPLVAIGENHRNQQIHDFIVALIRDPRFPRTVNDIVVEFGNARYQATVDRYTAGEPVSREALRRVWRETVNILVWDAPVYQRLFQTVREVNQRRPHGPQVRVLLADPPLDWATLHDREQWERVAATRDEHAAEVVEREVLAKQRRALLVFGSGHVTRDKAFDAYGGKPGGRPNLAEFLAQHHPESIFLVWAHMDGWMTSDLDPRLASWPTASFAELRGTWVGAASVGPRGESPTLEQLADGFLYLGPTSRLSLSKPSSLVYSDTAYLRELLRRNELQGGFNTSELEVLRRRHLPGKP